MGTPRTPPPPRGTPGNLGGTRGIPTPLRPDAPAIDPRHTVAWQRLRARVIAKAKRLGLPCAGCGNPIDYTLSGRTRWGPSVDHIDPIHAGGDALPAEHELQVMHLRCNVARGNRTRNAHAPAQPAYSNPRY